MTALWPALVIWNEFSVNVPAFKKSNTQSKWSQIAKQQANVIKKIQLFNRVILFWRVKEATVSPCNSFLFFFTLLLQMICQKLWEHRFHSFWPTERQIWENSVSFWAIKKNPSRRQIQNIIWFLNLFSFFCDFSADLKGIFWCKFRLPLERSS